MTPTPDHPHRPWITSLLALLGGSLLLALSACGGVSPRQLLLATALEETASAILTATQAARLPTPTATEIPTEVVSAPEDAEPTETLLPLPTMILVPDSGPTSTVVFISPPPPVVHTPTNDPNCLNDSDFIADISVPDGSQFAPKVLFTKTWRLRNSGSCTWDASYSLVHLAGESFGPRTSHNLVLAVGPGQEVDISVNFLAPEIPGTYTSWWQLEAPDGTRFGTKPFLSVVIVAEP